MGSPLFSVELELRQAKFAGGAHGHLAHEQQREGFKFLGEVRAQALPRRAHSKNMAALSAFATRQPAGDLAAVLEHIEMPPRQHFGVVVAENQPALFRTAH